MLRVTLKIGSWPQFQTTIDTFEARLPLGEVPSPSREQVRMRVDGLLMLPGGFSFSCPGGGIDA